MSPPEDGNEAGNAAGRVAGPAAVIFGCAGLHLDEAEKTFFRDADPLGFILFARNCESAGEISLVGELRGAVGRADAPILIDQEGGRVARLKPPLGHIIPPARRFGVLYERDNDKAVAAAWAAGRLIAHDLAALGIDVDCGPVLDLARPETTAAIGDRAFAGAPDAVAALGREVAHGLLAGGVLPVIKHMPGHGRARTDSHLELPTVAASASELERADFAPFRALADLPLGMTAHVRYTALDAEHPATHSPTIIGDIVRDRIGFDGLLMSDDLAMQALTGKPGTRAARALAAGCDIALHCTGRMEEMQDVADNVVPMTPQAGRRWSAARSRIDGTAPDPPEIALKRFFGSDNCVDAMLEGRVATVADALGELLSKI